MPLKFINRDIIPEIITPSLFSLGFLSTVYDSKHLIDRIIFQDESADITLGLSGVVLISTAFSINTMIPKVRYIEMTILKQLLVSNFLMSSALIHILYNYQPWIKVYKYLKDDIFSLNEFNMNDIFTLAFHSFSIGVSCHLRAQAEKKFELLYHQSFNEEVSFQQLISNVFLVAGIGYIFYKPQPYYYLYDCVKNVGCTPDSNSTEDFRTNVSQLELIGLGIYLQYFVHQPNEPFIRDNNIAVKPMINTLAHLCASFITEDLSSKTTQLLYQSYSFFIDMVGDKVESNATEDANYTQSIHIPTLSLIVDSNTTEL